LLARGTLVRGGEGNLTKTEGGKKLIGVWKSEPLMGEGGGKNGGKRVLGTVERAHHRLTRIGAAKKSWTGRQKGD